MAGSSATSSTGDHARASRIVGLLLTVNGGYVDTAGFLALQGLFSAHVTGNFVTIGATLVQGTSGALAKLLALPVFCLSVLLCRFLSGWLKTMSQPVMPWMLLFKTLLLALAAGMALLWGPFADSDTGRGLLMGMTLVVAMALQNASHRAHLTKLPPSTLMTGTTTQIMLDLADVMDRRADKKLREQALARVRSMAFAVVLFAAGCVGAALMTRQFGTMVFVLPPLIAAAAAVVSYQCRDQES